MKFHGELTRTFTKKVQIEAESQEEADHMVEIMLNGLADSDFSPVVLDHSVAWPVYEKECSDCHRAEAFAELPWCARCAREKHAENFSGYLQSANERMENMELYCQKCDYFLFNCQYVDHPLRGMLIYCPRCFEEFHSWLEKYYKVQGMIQVSKKKEE